MTKKLKKGFSQSKLSVRELKTWLDGYCSAHGEEWAPSIEQWAIIKSKIFSLIETENQHTQSLPAQQPAFLGPTLMQPPPTLPPTSLPPTSLSPYRDTSKVVMPDGTTLMKTPNGESGEPSAFT